MTMRDNVKQFPIDPLRAEAIVCHQIAAEIRSWKPLGPDPSPMPTMSANT